MSTPVTSLAVVGRGFMGAGIAETAALAVIPDRDSARARITVTSELMDVAGADLVVEAVPENVELRTSIMEELDGIVADDAGVYDYVEV